MTSVRSPRRSRILARVTLAQGPNLLARVSARLSRDSPMTRGSVSDVLIAVVWFVSGLLLGGWLL